MTVDENVTSARAVVAFRAKREARPDADTSDAHGRARGEAWINVEWGRTGRYNWPRLADEAGSGLVWFSLFRLQLYCSVL